MAIAETATSEDKGIEMTSMIDEDTDEDDEDDEDDDDDDVDDEEEEGEDES